MVLFRGVAMIAAALMVPIACGKKQEQTTAAPATSASSIHSGELPVSASSGAIAAQQEPAATSTTSATPLASALVAPAPSMSVSASASANAPGPLATKLVGYWVFSAFDLTDASTSAKWNAVPPTMQKEILAEAPKATIEFTKDKLISRLTGVPDKTSTWTIESEDPNDIVIKTSDEGRKKIRFTAADQIRIEELDKKGSFVTLFARTTKPAPAPSVSVSVVKP